MERTKAEPMEPARVVLRFYKALVLNRLYQELNLGLARICILGANLQHLGLDGVQVGLLFQLVQKLFAQHFFEARARVVHGHDAPRFHFI